MMKQENILQIVCQHFEVDMNLVKSQRRKQNIVTARQSYCYLCFLFTRLTQAKIGELINRDHSTVIHSITTISNLITVDRSLRESIEFLKDKIKTEPSIIAKNIDLLQMSKNYTNSFIN